MNTVYITLEKNYKNNLSFGLNHYLLQYLNHHIFAFSIMEQKGFGLPESTN